MFCSNGPLFSSGGRVGLPSDSTSAVEQLSVLAPLADCALVIGQGGGHVHFASRLLTLSCFSVFEKEGRRLGHRWCFESGFQQDLSRILCELRPCVTYAPGRRKHARLPSASSQSRLACALRPVQQPCPAGSLYHFPGTTADTLLPEFTKALFPNPNLSTGGRHAQARSQWQPWGLAVEL